MIHVLNGVADEFDDTLGRRRTMLLDVFEGLLGHTDQWSMIRQKLLKFLGDSGLRGDLHTIIENAKRDGLEFEKAKS